MVSTSAFLSGLLATFLVLDPLYDWATTSSINVHIGSVLLSEVYLLLVAIVLLAYFLLTRFKTTRVDSYVFFGLGFLLYQTTLDSYLGYDAQLEYAPRMILNILLYLAACRVNPNRLPLFGIAAWHTAVYVAGALYEMPNALYSPARVSSIFGNPNFLAFNTLNVIMMILLASPRGWAFRLTWVASVGLILLSKTRSVFIAVTWFIWPLRGRRKLWFLVCALATAPLLFLFETFRFTLANELLTLNGRIAIWTSFLEATGQLDLLLGSGSHTMTQHEIAPLYDSVTGQQAGYFQAQSHYIQLLANTGVVGLFLWWAQITGYLLRLRRMLPNQTLAFGAAFVAALLTIQIVENDIFANPTVNVLLGLIVAHGRHNSLSRQQCRQ